MYHFFDGLFANVILCNSLSSGSGAADVQITYQPFNMDSLRQVSIQAVD